MVSRIIKIFDTTLRDGEQSPGNSMTLTEKLEMAKQLSYLNVDVIEAGFPISSPGDFESVKSIAQQVKGPVICGLARMRRDDIQAVWDAVQYSGRPRIHTFISTSPLHMAYKLRKSPEEVLKITMDMVRFAKSLCEDVEFSAEDASRSEPEFLYRILETAIAAGATTLNIPDTVGYAIPSAFGALIKDIRSNVSGIEKVDISVHCHNDLGLAVANSLSAVENGANQIEVAVNGIGERAGNAALEEIAMALYVRQNYFDAKTNINAKEIYRTSKLLTNITGVEVQLNKAIVGANAFLHESGIHQDGMLKHRETYEILAPEVIGLMPQALVLGKHSGRAAFKDRLDHLGFHVGEEQLQKAFETFKILADEKKLVSDKDIESIVLKGAISHEEVYQLESVQVSCGTGVEPTASVKITKNSGEVLEKTGHGTGPVDAIYNTVEELVGRKINLMDYIVHAVTGGTDALGEVTVRIKEGDRVYTGRGSDTDVMVASAQAFLSAINKMLHYQKL